MSVHPLFNRYKFFIYSFLVSFLSLFAEMHLTRLLSFKSWNHVLYIIITLALLGYGIGSTITTLRKNNSVEALPWCIIAQSLLFVFACFAIGSLPIDNLQRGSSAGVLIVAYFIASLPFILSGFILSVIFVNIERYSFSAVYFTDLLGAAFGIAMFFPAITHFGVYRSIELAAMVAIILIWLGYISKHKVTLLLLLIGLSMLLPLDEDSLKIPVEPKKELGIARAFIPRQYEISFSAWYPLGKVQTLHPLTAQAAVDFISHVGFGTFMIPTDSAPDFHYFMNNAGAWTPAYSLSAKSLQRQGIVPTPFVTPMEFPFLLVHHPRTFIIGTGGGRDIYTALLHQAKKVRGAEINPLIFRLMKNGFLAEYTDNLYNKPNVTVSNIDGRSLVKQELQKGHAYDLIILNGVDTFTAAQTGAFTFSESYIYTQEAADEYLRLLGDNGMINFNRWHFFDYPRETLKLFITAVHALRNNGIERPSQNLFYATCLDWGMLLIKKTAFTPQEQALLIRYLNNFGYAKVLYQPYGGTQENPFVSFIKASEKEGIKGENEFIRHAPMYVRPATDDKPFFFRCYKAGDLFKRFGRWDISATGGYYVVFVQFLVLLSSCVAVLCFIILPVFTRYKRSLTPLPVLMMTIYFVSIGIAYIFIEITLMQRTTILFGSPIYPMGIVMGTLLLATGVGSFAMKRCQRDLRTVRRRLLWVSAVLCMLTVTFLLCSERFFDFLLGMPFACNVCVIAMLSAAFGFLLGTYFPSGILAWGQKNTAYIPWAYAINSGSTVISSMLAIIVAQAIGFNCVFLISLLLYFVALAVFLVSSKLHYFR